LPFRANNASHRSACDVDIDASPAAPRMPHVINKLRAHLCASTNAQRNNAIARAAA